MRNFIKKCSFFLMLACLTAYLATPLTGGTALAAAPAANREALREELEKLIRENPELILDVLRENSETVLDIAQQGSELRRLKILKAQWESDLRIPKSVRLAGRPALGQEKAPVTIVAFTDFTCAYCQQGERTLQRIFESYGDKVRLVYKSLPMATHPGSVEAAQFMLAAYAQDKNKSWALFHDFFNNRDRILANDGHAFMRSAAMQAGLNINKLLEEAKSPKVQKIIDEDGQDADILGFEGTPSFLVNDIVIRGALQEPLFRAAVDMALAEAERK